MLEAAAPRSIAPWCDRFRRLPPAFWFLLPSLGILFLLTLYPTLFLLLASFRRWSLLAPDQSSWIGLQNFLALTQDGRLLHALGNTLLFSIFGVVAELVLGMLVALLLAREFFAATLARGLLLLPMITTPIVVGLMWRLLYDPNFGQVNWILNSIGLPGPAWLTDQHLALPSLILTDIWEWTPFVALIMLAGLQSLPRDPYEAASIDGAGPIEAFFAITLPLMRPLIFVAALFRAMDSLRWFDTIYLMTNGGPGTTTETANLYGYIVSFNNANVGYGSAVAVAVLALVLIASKVLVAQSGIEDEAA